MTPLNILMHYHMGYCPEEGVGKVIAHVGSELEKKAIHVHYLFGYDAPAPYSNYLKFFRSRWMKFWLYTPMTLLFFMWWIRDKDFDVVHSHSPEAAFDAIWAQKILRKKYRTVIQFHGLNEQLLADYREEARRLNLQLEWVTLFYLHLSALKARWCIPAANGLVAISAAVKREIRFRWDLPVSVIPNGVERGNFYPIGKKSSHLFKIVFVGNVAWRKGLFYLIRALEELPESVRLTCIGLAPPAGLTHAGDRVQYIAHLSPTELNKQYNSADVLVMPALNEPFGLVYLEAMSSGLPVIGCTGTGADDFVEDGKNGLLVPKRSPHAIAEKIRFLLKFNNEKMGRHAIQTAKKYSWKKAAEAFEKYYFSILENNAARVRDRL